MLVLQGLPLLCDIYHNNFATISLSPFFFLNYSMSTILNDGALHAFALCLINN